MRKSFIYILALLIMASCQTNELTPDFEPADDTLYASMEAINATKTVMDENNNVLWSEGDQLVAFMKTTLGVKYQIKEQYVGTSTGGFSKINEPDNGDDLEAGQELDHNVVVYPHSYDVWCMKNDKNTPAQSYKLNMVLPETQIYEENSFAIGAFPMVAVSEDNKLTFKNICGGLKLQLKGADKIKSIKLEGLGNEKISGKSTVVGHVDGSAPAITMAADNKSYSHVILDCGDGVQLSETTPTTFIIAVPPVEFASGMKITVTDADGLSRTLTNSSSNTIKRSSLLTFPVITYQQEGVFEIPEGTLTSYEILAEGGTVEIPLTTNQEYQVVIPEGAGEWISVAETKVLRNETLTLVIAENGTTEARSAEVLITTADGATLQSITILQEAGANPNDYIDEYGIKHGPGIEINGVTWAPVNCGYHAENYKYGKLYQWGRKYGQGDYYSSSQPSFETGGVSFATGNLLSNSNVFYKGGQDWANPSNDCAWNDGTEWDPIKTEYDPCPKGWRIPTDLELDELMENYSSKITDNNNNEGFWLSGSTPYSTTAPRVFFTFGLYRDKSGSSYYGAYYWSSLANDQWGYKGANGLRYNNTDTSPVGINGYRSEGYYVRCVKEGSVSHAAEQLKEVAEKFKKVINLSEDGTANSYIVSEVGSYKFTPTKGNSSESVGVVSYAEVLWESNGTNGAPLVGSLIKNISYSDGCITFQTPYSFEEGNAVIAARDASGTILWSWHIWLTDDPQGQVYYNDAGIMMDRNLGATSTTPGDRCALGLLYQWGRKDPFLNASGIYSTGAAGSTLKPWPTSVESNSLNGTIEFSIAHPTTFINGNSTNYDWYFTGSSSTDNTRWAETNNGKTIYDPCPHGWRVPVISIWANALGSNSEVIEPFDDTNKGMNLSNKYGPEDIWYPASGYRDYLSGNIGITGRSGKYWSSSAYDGKYLALCMEISNSSFFDPESSEYRAEGLSVRCVKE